MSLSRPKEHVFALVSKISGTGVGGRTQSFLQGLKRTVPATLFSRVVCGLATLLAARRLGPAAYGQASLVLAATTVIQVPLLMGLSTAITHYIPKATAQAKASWALAGLRLLAISTTLTLLIGYVFAPFWSRLQGLSPDIFRWAILWCLGFALYTAGTALLIGMEDFQNRSWIEVLFAILFSGSVIFLHQYDRLTVFSYIASFVVAYAASGLCALGLKAPSLQKGEGTRTHMPELLKYGVIASLGSVVVALFNSPSRLIANYYLNTTEVGILSAYQGASIQMAMFSVGIISQVFFPLASRTSDKGSLFKKINRFMLFSIPAALLGHIGILVLYFMLLGGRYPLEFANVLVYSAGAVISLFFSIFTWYLAALGKHGMFLSSVIGLIAGGANLVFCFFLIPGWKVGGAGMAIGLGYAVGTAVCYLPFVQRYAQKTY